MKTNPDATRDIAKALHHLNAAAFYIRLCIVDAGAQQAAKQFLNQRANDCDNTKGKISCLFGSIADWVKVREDMEDPLALDGLTDAFVSLSPANRTAAEDFIAELLEAQNQPLQLHPKP